MQLLVRLTYVVTFNAMALQEKSSKYAHIAHDEDSHANQRKQKKITIGEVENLYTLSLV